MSVITLVLAFLTFLPALSEALILPANPPLPRRTDAFQNSNQSNIPLIIWHGLGDSFDSPGIREFGELYQKVYPNSQVYTVHLGDTGGADRYATFFGNVTSQINATCQALEENSDISKAPAANYLGFSQGGQFARALIESCNIPPARNLVTFGSQHNGITRFADCAAGDWWCRTWSGTLKGNTWGSFAQGTLVPAQYYRDPENIESYLNYSNFLADANNERKRKKEQYKKNMAQLDRFVMYMFEEEQIVYPKASAWFAELNETTGITTSLRNRAIYKEDWLGLRSIDDKGGLIFETTPGKHMQFGDDVLEQVFEKYMAPVDEKAELIPVTNIGDPPKTQLSLTEEQPLLADPSQRTIRFPCRPKHMAWSTLRRLMESVMARYHREFDPAGDEFFFQNNGG
ncbi:MAG: hypothetical protein M1831_004421 [Alyxoria varia]|nr:MAG: hypothetical protein M1831_004421 [Alyxoria varia]